jgi:tRNA G18 (ribose-2'-O)-methylase SpoU
MIQCIDALDDPRVAVFRNLPDRTLRGEQMFVAEGRALTQRLLTSRYPTAAVLCAEQHAAEFEREAAGRCPVYTMPEPLLIELVGYRFHLGVLAAGRRLPPWSLDELMAPLAAARRLTLAICPEVTKPENLGLVFRSTAALGVDGLLLGRLCYDPFSRRCLRVSMGGVFRVPWAQSADVPADFRALHERYGVELAATVLDPAAEPIDAVRWPPRVGLVFGSEYDGLRHQWLELCQRRITIPMQPGTDSLNLGVAAGIFLYEAQRRRADAGAIH